MRDTDGQAQKDVCVRSSEDSAGHAMPPLRAWTRIARVRTRYGELGVAAHTDAHVPLQFPHCPSVQLTTAPAGGLEEGEATTVQLMVEVTVPLVLLLGGSHGGKVEGDALSDGTGETVGVEDRDALGASGLGVFEIVGVTLGVTEMVTLTVAVGDVEAVMDGVAVLDGLAPIDSDAVAVTEMLGVTVTDAVADGDGVGDGTATQRAWATLYTKVVSVMLSAWRTGSHTYGRHATRPVALSAAA